MIFLRHPRPGVEPGICYGRLDLDIHEDGHGQIERAVELAPPARLLLASPALRCRRLAEAIAYRNGLEIRFDERLWEMNMGDWEGLPWKDYFFIHPSRAGDLPDGVFKARMGA